MEEFLKIEPKISKTSFIATNAQVIGAVEVGEYSSIWFNVVARADINRIRIGSYSNVQDGSVIHVDDDLGTYIGDYVTIGHSAVIHACRIGDYSLIGMGAVILNGAIIGKSAKVAAGAVVCEKVKIPDYTLVMGMPAKVIRELTEEEKKENEYWAKKYTKLAQEYKERGHDHG